MLAFAVPARAQQSTAPHLAYVYPAGGRQGATFQVEVAGQYLGTITNAYITGGGIQAEVIAFDGPLTGAQQTQLQDRQNTLQAKRTAAQAAKNAATPARATPPLPPNRPGEAALPSCPSPTAPPPTPSRHPGLPPTRPRRPPILRSPRTNAAPAVAQPPPVSDPRRHGRACRNQNQTGRKQKAAAQSDHVAKRHPQDHHRPRRRGGRARTPARSAVRVIPAAALLCRPASRSQ